MVAKQTVLLTGGSKGLGLAITKILLETFNANVIALSRTRGAALQSLIDAHHDALLVLECDVTDTVAIGSAVAQGLDRYQGIDGVILNAGVLEPMGEIASDDIPVEQWKQLFDINFFSLVTAVRATLPALRKSSYGGRVVFMSSGAATGNIPGWGPYNASKAAMNSLCRTIAVEEPDVTFVALRPGKVNTEMQALIRERGPKTMPDEVLQIFVDAHANGELVAPEDAGHVAAALALKAPRSLSGQFVDWKEDLVKEFQRA